MLRFSEVSQRRQQLIRTCQKLNFGVIRSIRLQNGDPVLEAASFLADERLDLPEEPRPEIRLDNFELCQEWSRLVALLDKLQNGMIERIEVRAGIPRRVVFESRLTVMEPTSGGIHCQPPAE